MTASQALPGFGDPAVGFDTPFDLLEACHERVLRSLALLQKLQDYLHDHRCDDSARQAARDVLRYFDIAAPLHQEDEELHVFPLLLERGTAEVAAIVRQLQGDHVRMEAHWQAARVLLQALAQAACRWAIAPKTSASTRAVWAVCSPRNRPWKCCAHTAASRPVQKILPISSRWSDS